MKKKKNIIKIENKKNLKKFLTEEEGKIAKKDIIKIGLAVIVIGTALSGLMKPDKTNAVCSHTSHASHGSHGSHGNHSSHCNCSSWN